MRPALLIQSFSKKREAALKAIRRFHTFDVMYYRTNLWLHSYRVSWIVEDMLPHVRSYYKKIDGTKAKLLALVHDDVEILTGDVPSWNKPRMTVAEKRAFGRGELAAAKELAGRYPGSLCGYKYLDLAKEALTKKTIEAQLAAYADKMDGHNESLHEIFAGNLSFLSSAFYYGDRFASRAKEFPFLRRIQEVNGSPFLELKLDINRTLFGEYRAFRKPFTTRSIRMPTAFPWYDRWRALTIEHLGKRKGLAVLIKKQEP